MTKICGDLVQLKTLVADFDKSVQTYNFTIKSFFDDIKKYNGWEGDSVVAYKSTVESESVNYYHFGDSLVDFSKVLSDIVDNAESALVTSIKR